MTSEIPKQYQRQCEEARLAHITDWQKSGLSMRQYCKQKGLNISTFSDWVKKMGKQTPAKFIPIELPAHQSKINSPQPKSLIIEFTNYFVYRTKRVVKFPQFINRLQFQIAVPDTHLKGHYLHDINNITSLTLTSLNLNVAKP